jgi:uncharacterized protein (TIGR02466 family)|tara:strand:- start:1250 stop:1864 length:615 start_codon:yes stop_codon:yes gene_type:complete
MEPVIHRLFGIPIYATKLNREFTSEEMEEVMKHQDQTMKNISNYSSINNYILKEKLFSNLKNDLDKFIADYFDKIIKPKNNTIEPYITQSWLNYTKEKESHHMHSHPNSIISGVLYIKCVENNDMIEFYDTVPNQFQIPPKEFTQYNSKRWWFNVAEKDLLLFPSTTTHAVQIKKENNLRISLAFNVFVKGNIGDNSDLTELIL